ncbi:glycosyltransferase family 2 protein [Streptodolium elevatio]|uniref:Glycosyltransferase n=1 Tax=Streptodolium elevatio TaxID=3157996 RepID=A0ABV3DMQ9_9ACTN
MSARFARTGRRTGRRTRPLPLAVRPAWSRCCDGRPWCRGRGFDASGGRRVQRHGRGREEVQVSVEPTVRGTSRISVITALYRKSLPYLPAAARSLATQDTPVDWIVCWDGDAAPPDVSELVEDQCRPHVPDLRLIAAGRAAGPSTARTVALSHVRTQWTAVLDADDEWLPGGLDRLLASAEATGTAWCAGLTDDLPGDGVEIAFPHYLVVGPQERGVVYDTYLRLGFLPFHGCAVLWRTSVLWDVGGWPALPTSEDTALVLAASERHPGHYLGGDPVYRYRRHTEQTVKGPEYAPRRRIAGAYHRARVEAIRATGGATVG